MTLQHSPQALQPRDKMRSAAAYTPADIEMVDSVKRWLTERNQTRAWLSRKTRIPGGTVSQILSLKYVSSPTRQLSEMLSALQVEADRAAEGSSGYPDCVRVEVEALRRAAGAEVRS